MTRVVSLFEQYVKLSNNLHYDAMIAAVRVDDPARLADTIAAHMLVGIEEKQNLLEIVSPLERLNRIASVLEVEVDKLQVDRRIQSRVKKQMEKAQKEYYLNEKMKAIQKELGRKEDKGNEIEDLKKKIEDGRMPKDVEEKAMQELRRLEAMPPMSAEATVSRNYLDWLIAVPWQKKSKESRDLKRAEEILNQDQQERGTVEGGEQPLVGIHDERVRPLDAVEQRPGRWRHHRRTAVRAVDVHPNAALVAHGGHAVEVVDDAGVGRAACGDRRENVHVGAGDGVGQSFPRETAAVVGFHGHDWHVDDLGGEPDRRVGAGRAATPATRRWPRRSHQVSRATVMAVRLPAVPPLTNTPPAVSGRPARSASQRSA